MSLQLWISAHRGVVLALAFGVAGFLSDSSVRNALAVHYTDFQTRQGYERAIRLEPGDYRNWYLLGRYRQYNLEDADTARAIQAYIVALSLNPASADIWSDLGLAYESTGDIPSARDAFLHAKRSYPLSAEVAWLYGNFLLRQGDQDAAFSEMRRAVEEEPNRGAEVLSRALRAEPNIDVILDRVLPPVSQAYLGAIMDQTAEGHTANAVKIWDRLALFRPNLSVVSIREAPFSLVGALLREYQITDAQRIWDEAISFAGLGNLPGPEGSLLWDGGFESGVMGGGLSWTFPEAARGVQVSLDTREKHSGNRSLRLLFNGRYNVHWVGPCHVVPVQPSTTYDFSAWMRTLSITTEQGIRFQLRPLGTQDTSTVVTPDLRGSQPWTRVEIPWPSGKNVQEMQVCVVRFPSQEVDDKIQGMAWVDDVSLVPVAAEPPKP
jgi:carbohydrate binding protein with CBM4/9 domain/tetratricopeptide repeat protein